MLKYILILALVLVAVFQSVKARKCETGDDCKDGECCRKMGKFNVCKSRVKPGRICRQPKWADEEKLVYRLTCPCVAEHECFSEQVGKRKMRARCTKPKNDNIATEGTEETIVETVQPEKPEAPQEGSDI